MFSEQSFPVFAFYLMNRKKNKLKSYQERNRVVIGIWKKIHLRLEIKCITSSFLHRTIDM